MTKKQALTDLLATVEAGDSFGIIPLGQKAFAPNDYHIREGDLVVNAFNGSLDAANVLHGAVLPGWGASVSVKERDDGFVMAFLSENKNHNKKARHSVYRGYHITPARAWLICILKVMISEAEHGAMENAK